MNDYLAEFGGTMLLLLLGNGVVASSVLKHSKGYNGGTFTIVFAWGIAVLLAALVVGKISGGHLNPAVSIAFAMAGEFEWIKVPGYIVAQIAGAMTGSALVWVLYKPLFTKDIQPEDILACFATSPVSKSKYTSLLNEIFGTTILIIGLFSISSGTYPDGISSIFVALLIMSIGLSLGGMTGFAINPARDLGPRIIHQLLPIKNKGRSEWNYSWIPIVGPVTGSVLGTIIYLTLLKP